MELRRLHAQGPFNPSAIVPPKVVKKLLALEFVEMGELRADIWPEEPVSSDTGGAPRHPSKPPVTTLRVWLECYGRRHHLQIPGEGCRTLGIPDHHHPRCPHLRGCELGCLRPPRNTGREESQLHNPKPPFVGWFQGTPHLQFGPAASGPPSTAPRKAQDVCRNFNSNRCRFTRCQYLHACTDCSGPHAAVNYPNRQPSSG